VRTFNGQEYCKLIDKLFTFGFLTYENLYQILAIGNPTEPILQKRKSVRFDHNSNPQAFFGK